MNFKKVYILLVDDLNSGSRSVFSRTECLFLSFYKSTTNDILVEYCQKHKIVLFLLFKTQVLEVTVVE